MSKPQWKQFASQLEPLTASDTCSSPRITPQTTKAMRMRPIIRASDPTASYQKSMTSRNTDRTFFPASVLADLPKYEPPKCSVKQSGIVKAYAANTNQGLIRNYNEDRVSIILNIVKPPSRSNETWPRCSFFGVYDGHGGSACADFLRDNLHQFVIKEPSFPANPREALKQGFAAAESQFLETVASKSKATVAERSGSCAIAALIVGDMCYVANVGDSRAVLSGDAGKRVFPLSSDHKPGDEMEQKRIADAGGKIYQSQLTQTRTVNGNIVSEVVMGPHRVLPGRLSVTFTQVSRTVGDAEAKMPRFGGNPNVIIAVPEIKTFRVNLEHDFILLASDGIFDKLTNREAVQSAWTALRESQAPDIHQQCGQAVEAVMKLALARRTLDNVTVVLVGLPGLLIPSEASTQPEDAR